MNTPLISVLHPTRRVVPSEGFPQGWRAAFAAYLVSADALSRIQYIVAVHSSRWEEFWAQGYFVEVPFETAAISPRVRLDGWRGLHSVVVVRNEGRDCAVDQMNAAAAFSEGLLLFGAQDDLFPPAHWDTLAIESLPCPHCGQIPDTQKHGITGVCHGCKVVYHWDESRAEVVIRCSSGSPSDSELTIAAFGSRSRFDRMGYMLHPAFDGVFSDNYFDFELRRDEKAGLVTVIERPDIQFEHRHPIFGKGKSDESYAQQNADENYRQGYATFAKLTMGTRVLALCFPGELFAEPAHVSQMRLAVHTHVGPRFLPYVQSGHCTDPHAVRIAFTKNILKNVPKVDLVYWQDDDNVVTVEQFDRLVADLDAHPELDGVCGWCWCDPGNTPGKALMPSCGRQHGWKATTFHDSTEIASDVLVREKDGLGFGCDIFTVEDMERAKDHGGLISSRDIYPDAFWSGFPCLLMRASVLERLGWEAFKPLVREDLERGYSSEDFAFFYHAHLAGLNFACDTEVCVPHLKVRPIGPLFGPEMQQAELEVRRVEPKGSPLEAVGSSAAD